MPNKIVVEIEALDYEVTVRDVEFALKKVFPNMPTVVKHVAAQQSVQRTDCPVCRGRGFNVDWNKNRVQCSTCNGTGISR